MAKGLRQEAAYALIRAGRTLPFVAHDVAAGNLFGSPRRGEAARRVGGEGPPCPRRLRKLRPRSMSASGRTGRKGIESDFRFCRVGPGNFTPSLSQIRT